MPLVNLLLAPDPVHPRVCGEHFTLFIISDRMSGSSPRMRGTSSHSVHLKSYNRFIPAYAGNMQPPQHPCFCMRFIPAYAGNILVLIAGAFLMSVHPRVCGEHTNCISLKLLNFQRSQMVTKNLHHFILCLQGFRGFLQREERNQFYPIQLQRNSSVSTQCFKIKSRFRIG